MPDDPDAAAEQIIKTHETAYHPGRRCVEDEEDRCADRYGPRNSRPIPTFADRIRPDDALTAREASALDELDQQRTRAEATEQERDQAIAERDERLTLAESSRLAKQIDNLREQLDRANTERARLAQELAEVRAAALNARLCQDCRINLRYLLDRTPAPSPGSSRRAQEVRIVPYAERKPLYAAYRAAHEEAERIGGELSDDSIIQAAVKAYEAARRAQEPAAEPVTDSIHLAERYLRASGIPVTGNEIRAWLDERGIPVMVGVYPLFDAIRRAIIAAGDAGYGQGRDDEAAGLPVPPNLIRAADALPAPKLATGGVIERPVDLHLGLPTANPRWPMGTITRPS